MILAMRKLWRFPRLHLLPRLLFIRMLGLLLLLGRTVPGLACLVLFLGLGIRVRVEVNDALNGSLF